MSVDASYDVAIAGGGLAGLSAAINLCRKGYRVAVFEKEDYPHHKVCGEYLSLESWNYLTALGLPLERMDLPLINKLELTAPNGKAFATRLPLGGFGISRYLLDHSLASLAKKCGAEIFTRTRVDEIVFNDGYTLTVSDAAGKRAVHSRLCMGAYGKRSNLDLKWNRQFVKAHDKRLDNFLGVKYHIRTDWPGSVIGLHNFDNGYCGISAVEEGKYCLCYMTHADNLRKSGGSIRAMESEILFRNPHLRKLFGSSEFLPGFPVTISQISFSRKTLAEHSVLMAGDSGGMIAPLCGNGMSIALDSGRMLAQVADEYLRGQLSAAAMEKKYMDLWKRQFALRMKAGRTIQGFFGSAFLSNSLVSFFRLFPFLARPVIKLTHGREIGA